MIIRILSTAILILLLSTSMAMAQAIIYVDADATAGANDGTSWDNAYTELADALKWAREMREAGTASWGAGNPLNIWVASGTYLPLYDAAEGEYTSDGGRDNAFVMVEFVNIYGGFAGDEDPQSFDLSTRDFEANETVLSGDLNGDDEVTGAGETLAFMNNEENVYHVVIGAFFDDTFSARLDGFTVSGGNADNSRGEILFLNSRPVSSSGGGGIYLTRGSFAISNTIISHNSTSGSGGGLVVSSANPVITDVNINRNRAQSGGGMSNNGSSPNLTRVVIRENHAEITGGGMRNLFESNATLTAVSFFNNSSKSSGGAIYNRESSPELFNVLISGNTSLLGGGIYNTVASSPSLRRVIFIGNSAEREGGGMYSFDRSNYVLSNVTISGNTAGTSGGGLFNLANSSPVLTNVVLKRNSAVQNGGGIFNSDESSPTVRNVTITDNSAGRGGGVYNSADSNPVLSNVIIWNNEEDGDRQAAGASVYNYNISALPPSTPEISYSLIANSGGSGSWNTAIGQDNGNNFDADPRFTGSNENEYSLANISPAINAGDPSTDLSLYQGGPSRPVDLAGNPRVFDGVEDIIDMGAYEFQGEPSPFRPADNNVLFVDRNVASGSKDGSSWENAIPELGDALKLVREQWDAGTVSWDAANPLNIWVANGTYLPLYDAADGEYTLDGGRDNAFVMVEHVNIYGGFAGDEDPASFDLNSRDFEANETILTGDINGDDQISGDDGNLSFASRSDNVGHVVISAFDDAEASVRLDGFSIVGGNAEGASDLFLVNGEQVFTDIGGGVYVESGNFYLANSIITQNSSSNVGGGIFGSNASLTLENTKVMQNHSSFGGGLSINNGSDAVLVGVVVASNEASASGGGLTVFNSDVQILNVTFYGNRANEGGGIQVIESQSADITNTIFRENANSSGQNSLGSDIFNSESTIGVNYSLTQTWDTGTGNIVGADPQFSDPAGGNYTLTNISPAINAGNPSTDLSLYPGGPSSPVDLAGNPRVFDGETDIIDMGAFEFQGEPDLSVSIDGSGIPGETLPKQITLSQNYPNPFNPSTNIQFELPQAGPVQLEVYDMVGRRVATLINEQVTAGSHTITFDAGSLSSGVYTYRLRAGGQIFTRQLTLIK